MYPTSAAFAEALDASTRRWSTRVEVLQSGRSVTELDVVLNGSVTLDDVAVRRSAKLTLIDEKGELTPVDAKDLLAPTGTEVSIARGLRLADGTVEYVPLGVFGVTEPEISSAGGGVEIRLDVKDRVDAVRKRRFWEPWRVAGGTATHTAITDIVTSRLTVPTRITQTGHTVPESIFDELSDPWDAVRDLAEADGLIAYFDPLGTLVVEPEAPLPTGIVYEPGSNAKVLDTSRWMSDEDTYSGVLVTGEHPDETPVRYLLWDTDPTSPTYYLGPFGRRPFGYSSPLVNSAAKAQAAAETIFARVTKMPQQMEMSLVGHPGHEVGDRVTIRNPDTHTSGDYVVVRGTIPLRASESMRLVLREVV